MENFNGCETHVGGLCNVIANMVKSSDHVGKRTFNTNYINIMLISQQSSNAI